MDIKVFGAEWCSGCKALKKQLQEKGVSFSYVDVDTPEGMQESRNHAVRSLPTIILGDEEKLVGNAPDVLRKILEYANV